MAANLSPRRRAAMILALPAVQFTGAFLGVTCGCGRSAWLHASDLATHGRDLTMAEGIRRLRCADCRVTLGGAGAAVSAEARE